MQDKKSFTRHQLRIMAFEYIFAWDVQKDDIFEIMEEDIAQLPEKGSSYVRQVVRYVSENAEQIDNLLRDNAKGWKVERLSKVALAALRLSISEITIFDDVPDSVSINEAVEIIKEYSDEKTATFANGILGALYKR